MLHDLIKQGSSCCSFWPCHGVKSALTVLSQCNWGCWYVGNSVIILEARSGLQQHVQPVVIPGIRSCSAILVCV